MVSIFDDVLGLSLLPLSIIIHGGVKGKVYFRCRSRRRCSLGAWGRNGRYVDCTFSSLYMTNEALRMKNKKQKLWKKYQASPNEYDRKNYISAKNGLRKLTRTLRRDFETKLARNAKKEPKQF